MLELFNHQNEALAFLEDKEVGALIMEQGTGKTITMLSHLSRLVTSGKIKEALIVAPLSAVGAWYRDAIHFPELTDKLTIINYERVWRNEENYRHWDCVVLDEAHKIIDNKSRQTMFFIGGAYGTPKKHRSGLNMMSDYRYVLTGTPLGNKKSLAWYCIMNFMKPGFYRNITAFKQEYCIEKAIKNTHIMVVVGFKRLTQLQNEVAPYIFQCKKIDCLDLPEKNNDELVLVPLKCESLYKKVIKGAVAEYEMVYENKLTAMTATRQLLSGHIKDAYDVVHPVKCEKIKYLADLMDSLDGKIVIFANFTRSIQDIEEYLTKKKIKFVTLDGRQKDKQIWRKFQEDDNIRVFIGQYTSANAGIDLFSANNIIYYEPTLSYNQLDQSRDRIHRIGQGRACSYYHLITEGTVEEFIFERLMAGMDANSVQLEAIANINKRIASNRK